MESPLNFNQIEPYVIHKKEQLLPVFTGKHTLFFYDTCSFQKHAQVKHPDIIPAYFKIKDGVIILTQCILMELCSGNASLCPDYVCYIQAMHQAGLTIVILQEEDTFSILDFFFSSTIKINSCLAWAVSTVNYPSNTVSQILASNEELRSLIVKRHSSDRSLFRRFFNTIRQSKINKDNLGEELLTICVHLLSSLPACKAFQYLVLTEDKGAIRLISNAADNSYRQLGFYPFSALTTPRLVQQLFEHNLVHTQEQLTEFLSNPSNSPVRLFGSEEYDLTPRDKSISPQVLAEKIATPGTIHINY